MRKNGQQGFTLIELMIVTVVIAIVMAISLPNLLSARISANESATVANLRTISNAQAQYQTSGQADVDSDGTGEYGVLSEMGGTRGVRIAADGTAGTPLSAAVLAQSFGRLNLNGEATRSGYFYRVFLPGTGNLATTEMTEFGDFSMDVDVDDSETMWCVYAWPQDATRSGHRIFFVNQTGDVTASYGGYTGSAAIDPANAGAGFAATNPIDSISGDTAVAAVGADGGFWVLAR